jgi:AcrR family transcriptional regulator
MDIKLPTLDSGHSAPARPGSGARAPDRRVERTRRTLHRALIGLILERGWDEISVKDVCEAADVGRSTFYAHFADKEELMASGFDGLGAWLRAPETLAHGRPDTTLDFVWPLIVHALEFRPLFRALIGKQSGRIIQRRFRTLVHDLVGEALAGRDLGELPREATVRFTASGVVEILSWMLESRAASAEAVDREIQALVGRVVRAA